MSNLKDALKEVSRVFKNFHDHKVETDTSHESTCVGVHLELYDDGSGAIILQGTQKINSEDNFLTKIVKGVGMNVRDLTEKHPFDLELEFRNIDELYEILKPYENQP